MTEGEFAPFIEGLIRAEEHDRKLLKPCPCGCGVHPVIYDYDGTFPRKTKWIKCPVCGWSTDAMTIEHCIEQWNRRVKE